MPANTDDHMSMLWADPGESATELSVSLQLRHGNCDVPPASGLVGIAEAFIPDLIIESTT